MTRLRILISTLVIFALAKLSPAQTGCNRDLVLDEVPGTLVVGSRTFECSRVQGSYRAPGDPAYVGKMAVAYTEVDTSVPSAAVERLHIRLAGGAAPLWCSAIHNVIRARDRNDPNTRNIRSIDMAIGDGAFHGIGWVEVTSTSDTSTIAGGQSTTFRYFVSFTTDDGQTWTAPTEVGSYQLAGWGLNYSGDIDLATNDAGKIGVLLPFDRVSPQATAQSLLGAATNDALAVLKYASGSLGSPTVWHVVASPATIDVITVPGDTNMIDLTAGRGGSYTIGAGWTSTGSEDVFHTYYAQAGTAKIGSSGLLSQGTSGSDPFSRQTNEAGTGFPMATNTYRTAMMNTATGLFEVPPNGTNNGLWKRTPTTLNRISGNRGSDTVFSSEASIASNDPRHPELFMMDTAGTVSAAMRLDMEAPLPHCSDVSSGQCYDYGSRQYSQEDRGALVGSTYYGTSIRRFYSEIASPSNSTELVNQIVIHAKSNIPEFASNISFDRIQFVNNSTNNTGAIRSEYGSPSAWAVGVSIWTPTVSGELGTLRSIMFMNQDPDHPCLPAPHIPAMIWEVRMWPSLAAFQGDTHGGVLIATFVPPSNPSYLTQYGIMQPAGCAGPGPTYDYRFDLSSYNIEVEAGHEYAIAVVMSSSNIDGNPHTMASSIGPTVDYYSGAHVFGEAIPLSSPFPNSPRLGRSMTVVPDLAICAASADIDADGDEDATDVSAFIDILLGSPANPCTTARADVNADGSTNGSDIQPFTAAYLTP